MLKNLSIASRIYGVVLTLLAAICVVAFVGLNLAATSNQRGRQTYEQSMKPLQAMGEISQLISDNRSQIMLALQHDPASPASRLHDHPVKMHADTLAADRDKVTALWESYSRTIDDPEARKLADAFADARGRYLKEGVQPALEMILAGNYTEAQVALLKKINPLYKEAKEHGGKLQALLQKAAADRLEASEARFTTSDLFAGSGALGFEAASRGARHVSLVERDARAVAALKRSAQTLGGVGVDLHRADALEFLATSPHRYDVVFLDPPYGQAWLDRVEPALQRVLAPHARIYVEAEAKRESRQVGP